MLFDWFTVGAQTLNFLILVWLMKRFLYRPVLSAIDAREERIAAQIAGAEKVKSDATNERDEFRVKNEAFDKERAALLSKATKEAEAERHQLLDEARRAADELRAKLAAGQRKEHAALSNEITGRVHGEVFAIARKALADLAGVDLEARMVDVFVRQLHAMDEDTRNAIKTAIASATEPARVRSAFELPAPQREAIQSALEEISGSRIPLQFQTASGMVSGIEFDVHGKKVVWSLTDYGASLEQSVGELLKSNSTPAVS